jgi:hypothetical protein
VRIGEMNRNPSGLLVSLVKAWVDEPIPMKKGNLTNIPGGPDIPDPRSIRLSDEAWEKFDEFETFVRERQNSLRESGLSGLWGKTEATAMKLALIHACSLRMTTEEIGIESANWGIELASLLTQNMVVRADKHISHSQIEADAKKLLRDIEHGGTKGIAHTELYQNNRKHGKKQFHDLIDALKDWGSISVYSEVKGSNKPQTRYIATAYLKKEIS